MVHTDQKRGLYTSSIIMVVNLLLETYVTTL